MSDATPPRRPVRVRLGPDRRRTIPEPGREGSAAARASAREDAICAISDLLYGRYAAAALQEPAPPSDA